EDQVPVVAQEAVGEHAHAGGAAAGLAQEPDERGEVAGLGEDRHAAVAAVDHVVDDAAGSGAGPAWHAGHGNPRGPVVQEGGMSPFPRSPFPRSGHSEILHGTITALIPPSGMRSLRVEFEAAEPPA